MSFFGKNIFSTLVVVFFVVLAISCEEELDTLGDGVIEDNPFFAGQEEFDVFAFNKAINAIQTNQLPLYQLGVFDDPIYGRTEARITTQVQLASVNPIFGNFTQITEDNPDPDQENQIQENETVTSVFLYIPYQTNQVDTDFDGVDDFLDIDPLNSDSDSDGDGVSDRDEDTNNTDPLNPDTDGDGIGDAEDDLTLGDRFPQRFNLDSIYDSRNVNLMLTENSNATFNLKVFRSNFLLRDLDPNSNFQEAQEYFSTQRFAPDFVDPSPLFDGNVTISDQQIQFIVEEDDPETEDIDEAGTISRTLPPGIRVPLDPVFFQEILDKEGGEDLLSNTNFTNFFRGLHLQLEPLEGEQLLLLLNLATAAGENASIEINYNFNVLNTSDETGTSVVTEEDTFTMNLLTGGGVTPIIGNAVNTLINDEYPPAIADALDNGENASRIFLKGSAGSFAEIQLFGEDDETANQVIEEIRSNNWIINEVNLTLHVDEGFLNTAGQVIQPPRLYLYNFSDNSVIFSFANENFASDTRFGRFLDYDGFLNTSNDEGLTYTFRITDHINNIIIREEENVPLGLTMTPDIRIAVAQSAMLEDGEREIPVASNIMPLGTVLFGSNVSEENQNQRLRLQIFFTETD